MRFTLSESNPEMKPKVRNKKYWKKPKLLPLQVTAITQADFDLTGDDLELGGGS